MFGVINETTRAAWQQIATDASRQRPYVGRAATVVGGRKWRGRRVTVMQHREDRYENAFRYGGEASQHMAAMRGRYGYVCLVRDEHGETTWIRAKYLACDFAYTHWSVALADAVFINGGNGVWL